MGLHFHNCILELDDASYRKYTLNSDSNQTFYDSCVRNITCSYATLPLA